MKTATSVKVIHMATQPSSVLQERINTVLKKGEAAVKSIWQSGMVIGIRPEEAGAFRAAGLSLIRDMYGTAHHHYKDFDRLTVNLGAVAPALYKQATSVIDAVNEEFRSGWLVRTRGLLAAEIFSDFIDMAEHLLEEGYKDAAAVIAGSALEAHLKRLAESRSISLLTGSGAHKTADTLNGELAKASVYDKNEQKQVTAWQGIRNDAAHGNYPRVLEDMVRMMIMGIRGFISRHPA